MSAFEVKMAIEKLTRHKSPGIDQILAELLKAGSRTFCSEIHKFINSVWNREELPQEWKESVTVPIYKKGDKTDFRNYRGLSILSTTYKILSNMLLSRMAPYAEEITGDHQCGFRHYRSTFYHIFCICQILEEKNGNTMKQCISYLYTSRKLMIQSGVTSCIIFSFSLVSPSNCTANKNVSD